LILDKLREEDLSMAQKLLKALAKIIAGLAIFYLVTGFIIIPLVLTWAIPAQGTKFLKHPVHLRSVGFNPCLLQLTLKGFEILGDHDRLMIGFDKLWVDVSLCDLFKKIYRIQVFELDGLKMNVALLAGNRIDLLALIPPLPVQAPSIPAAAPAALPVVILDQFVLHQGQIHFIDKTITPNFSTTLGSIELQVTHVTTDPSDQAKIRFQAALDEKGRMTMETLIKPLAKPLDLETSFTMNDYALMVLTPYVGKYTGHELKNGTMELRMDYRISGNKLTARHKFLIQKFEFGQNVASKDALHLPFGLAVALLEDTQGKINIDLPVTGDMSSPKFKYLPLVGQVVRNFFLKIVTKPFSFLSSVLGGSDNGNEELGFVNFAPGRAQLAPQQKQKLMTLIKGLKERPKLHLEIDGSYDPQVDWKAMQVEVFTKDYEDLRKRSSKSESAVYQLLYQRRFGIRSLWALTKKYKEGVGQYNDLQLDQEIKRQLIEKAPPDQGLLGVLAQARAQVVHDFFLSAGLDSRRLSAGSPRQIQSSMGFVPLEFTLTVF